MIVPLGPAATPGDVGTWGWARVPWNLCAPGGPRSQRAETQRPRAERWAAAFLPRFRGGAASWSLQVDKPCREQAVQGVQGHVPAPLQASSSRPADTIVCLHVCAGQAQGAGEAGVPRVRLVCLARLCLEEVTQRMGQARALSWGHCLQILGPGQHLLDAKWRLLLPGRGGSTAPSWAVNASGPCPRSAWPHAG